MTSPFDEVVRLRVQYEESKVLKAQHDVETLQRKASGIPLSLDVRQESFRRAAAQLDAATKLRTATVQVNLDERPLSNRFNALRKNLDNTKFTVALDKTNFDNKLEELELKRISLATKFRDGFKTQLDADAAMLSVRRLAQEADTLHDKLARIGRERIALETDKSGIASLGDGLKNAVMHAGNLRSMISGIPGPVIAAAGATAVLTGSVLATGAAAGLTVAAIGGLAIAAVSNTQRMKESFGDAAAFIKYSFTNLSASVLPSVERISTKLETTFVELEPLIRRAVLRSGPLLETLADGAINSLKRLAPSIDNLVQKSGPLMEGLANGMVTIAGAVGNVMDRMADSSYGAGQGVELLSEGVAHLVVQIGDLIQAANTVAGALGAVKQTVELVTGSLPQGSQAFDKFTEGVTSAVNPLSLFLNTLETFDEAARKFSPKLVTVHIQGKAVVDPNFRPENIFKIPNSQVLPGLAESVKSKVDEAKGYMNELQQAFEFATIGGRYRISLDTTDAQNALTAVTGLRNAWQSSIDQTSQAETRAAQVSAQNAAAIVEANRSIASAEESVRNAQANVKVAQDNLNQARRDAALDIQNMKNALRDLGDNEEAALIRLERAKLAAEEAALAKGQEFTQDQLNARAAQEADLRRRETLLEVKNAEENLSDVRASGQATREEIAAAEARGIENHPLVLAAMQQLTGATNAEKSAQDQLVEANWRLEQVQRENKNRMDEVSAALAEQRTKTDEQHAAYENLLHMLGLTDAQVVQYGQHLKDLPTAIDQFIKLHGLEDVLQGSARLSLEIDAQRLMAENPGMTPEEALNKAGARHVQRKLDQKLFESLTSPRPGLGLQSRRDGGPISGPGDARSDSVPIWAATGEFMQPADAVQHYGTGFMEAIRKKEFPKFADGGSIGYDLNVDMRKWAVVDMMRKSGIVQRARDNALGYFSSIFGGGGGLGSSTEHSYMDIFRVAKKFDPGAVMTSGLRDTPDNHGKGIAADFGGNMLAIAKGFMGIRGSLMQLIHSGGSGYFVANGQVVSGPGIYGAGEVANHYNHVHVAARKDAMQAILNGSSAGAPGGSVERWRGMVNQALQIMGQPATFANSTLRRMNQESGGNPTIVNRTDSNWTAGTPSVGLMQVIGPTYRANRHPAYDKGPYTYGVSTDPLANTLASMRYALGRYGSLPAAYDRPGGYKDGGYIFDEGGMLPTGISVVNNQTGKPEPLLNADKSISLDTGSIMQLARVLAQLLAGRPAKLMLPDGRMLAETVGDSIIGEATAPGVSY
jgi:hypothetical protein